MIETVLANGESAGCGGRCFAGGVTASARTSCARRKRRCGVAADVFARLDRRVRFRLEMGARRGDPFSLVQLLHHLGVRRSHARGGQASVYGGGACRFCGGVGRVLSKNRAQRMDGVPRRAVGGGFGKVCVFDFGGGLSKRISADGRRRLVADSIGASGTCIAGGRRAFYRDGLGGIALTG